MDRRAVGVREARGDLDRADRVRRGHRPHRHHGRPGEGAGRHGRDRGVVHRHHGAGLEMLEPHPFGEQRLFEGERAAEHEGDEVVAPKIADVGHLVDQFAVAKHVVAADVGPDVDVLAQGAQHRIAGVGDADQRTGLRVALAIAGEIQRKRGRQNRQVALHVARRHRRGVAGMRPASDQLAGLDRRFDPCHIGCRRKRRFGRQQGLGHGSPPRMLKRPATVATRAIEGPPPAVIKHGSPRRSQSARRRDGGSVRNSIGCDVGWNTSRPGWKSAAAAR